MTGEGPQDIAAMEALLPPCPACGAALHICVSSCQDQGCCGIPNSIRCGGCDFEREQYGRVVDLIEDFAALAFD